MTKFFVYIKDFANRPQPQLWYGKQTDGNGKAKETLFIKELDQDHSELTLSELMKLYPYEAKS